MLMIITLAGLVCGFILALSIAGSVGCHSLSALVKPKGRKMLHMTTTPNKIVNVRFNIHEKIEKIN